MSVSSLIAAKKVCQFRDWQASNLEIQKTLYIAHMVSLGRSEGQTPLVTENFQAWDYGPVLPNVYSKAKVFGDSPVQNIFQQYANLTAGDEANIIKETVAMLAGKSPGELVAITHWEKGAWAAYYRPGARGITIPNSKILEEYRRRVQ